ncbi:hypothetical protein Cni_G02023 [Canna indica]|uniref:Uncharacterized protein n=1 Tax=Canna indica TaxID=4628 RepID=A0AAQ3JRF3_9LILI|nr:hypothetical protein Cni_G02023 [Canna indica]
MRKSKPTRSIEKLNESCIAGSSKDQQRKRKASTSLNNHGISKISIQETEGGLTTVDNGATIKTRGRKSKRTKNGVVVYSSVNDNEAENLNGPSNGEVICSSVNDNEAELTVDDLVHIAEEVRGDDYEQQQIRRCTSRFGERIEMIRGEQIRRADARSEWVGRSPRCSRREQKNHITRRKLQTTKKS